MDTPERLKELSGKAEQFPSAFPVCVITRAQARNLQDVVDLSDSFLASDGVRVETKVFVQPELMLPAGESVHKNHKSLQVGRKQLAMFQKSDLSLKACVAAAVDKDSLPEVGVAFYWDNEVLMRRWKKNDTFCQIVIPSAYRAQILTFAHDHVLSGHLGIRETYERVLRYFFWPGMKSDICRVMYASLPASLIREYHLLLYIRYLCWENLLSGSLWTVLDRSLSQKPGINTFSL